MKGFDWPVFLLANDLDMLQPFEQSGNFFSHHFSLHFSCIQQCDRNFVDAPPFNVMNMVLQVCLLGTAMMWGGVTATIAAFLFILGVDFFLIDPLFALGVHDWRELAELTFGSALGLGFGITASRMVPLGLGGLR